MAFSSLYILSDLHLWNEDDPLMRRLILFLEQTVQSGDRVVFAGDIFDLFVGDKEIFRKRYQEVFLTFEKLISNGVTIDYIEGNHDFLLMQALKAFPEIHHHESEVVLDHGGKKLYIAHGDLVDQNDTQYLLLRKFFRSSPFQLFVHFIPGKIADWIGTQSSQYSRNQKPLLPQDYPKEKRDRLRMVYHEFAKQRFSEGFDFVVLGHCHDLDEFEGRYFNIGYPRIHGSVLKFQDGKMSRLPL